MCDKSAIGKKETNGMFLWCRGLSDSYTKQYMTFGGKPFNCQNVKPLYTVCHHQWELLLFQVDENLIPYLS